ncbi:hypothetical protein C2G38_2155290 [Gigaspora rosea]|uniref:Uncharacterized protein n=1 Tax=Gigaspora rosea TaxID=44941 RepID=A0A397W5X8_9GLOM|nr:hypothetical protein C2G38_2155290 [Gigaspora rosea]
MTTNEALIRQDLLTTEPSFVAPAPCPYNEAQRIATQLVLAHDKVKRAKNCGRRIDTLAYAFYFGAQLSTAILAEKAAARKGYIASLTKDQFDNLNPDKLVVQALFSGGEL